MKVVMRSVWSLVVFIYCRAECFINIMRDHMMDVLIKHKLINLSQHGFLKAKSCLTNVLCFLEEITKWVDDGSPIYVIYLDFLKVFDNVPHQRLILKLKSNGM